MKRKFDFLRLRNNMVTVKEKFDLIDCKDEIIEKQASMKDVHLRIWRLDCS